MSRKKAPEQARYLLGTGGRWGKQAIREGIVAEGAKKTQTIMGKKYNL